jgi:phosphoribosylformimino-5-aminoimidazole carboxamide ribotide isomerase
LPAPAAAPAADEGPLALIPVLDLMGGQVVRALRGERSRYLPMRSLLCAGSDPVTLARALCEHSGSPVLYVADLDALQGGPAQAGLLRALTGALPGCRLWLDAGFADAAAAHALFERLGEAAASIDPVYASESLRGPEALAACFAPGNAPGDALGERALLSLDRRDGQRLDPAGAWQRPDLWPRRVVVMTLERVGADAGPDLATLAGLRARSPGSTLIGAGGVRGPQDLVAAAAAGAQGWLVASALHDGRLPAAGRAVERG